VNDIHKLGIENTTHFFAVDQKHMRHIAGSIRCLQVGKWPALRFDAESDPNAQSIE
jgi:hypothetical protein